jgi:hypothetical protein
VLDENDFGNLGFYSLGLLYCVFGFCSFIASPIVKKIGARWCLILGAFCYSFYVGSFVLPAYRTEFPDSTVFLLDKTFIFVFILIAACINGFGAAILWVAQG